MAYNIVEGGQRVSYKISKLLSFLLQDNRSVKPQASERSRQKFFMKIVGVFIACTMLTLNVVQAQNHSYIPFADNATWSVSTIKYKTIGDTIINDLHYLKVYMQEEYLPFDFDINRAILYAFLRNDTANKRVYKKGVGLYSDTTERLWYDFSLQKGDTIILENGMDDSFYVFCVDTVEIIAKGSLGLHAGKADTLATLTDATFRRQILVNVIPVYSSFHNGYMVPQIWIEGVGSTNGLFDNIGSDFNTLDGGYPRLLCYAQEETLLLTYPIFDLDTIPNDCFSQFAGLNIVQYGENQNQQIKLYPNPTEGAINIEAYHPDVLQNATLSIYNMLGMCVIKLQTTSDKPSIDVSNLPAGVYTIQIKNSALNPINVKFLKK